ncbi:unnamed protein product [Brachionus calyciflorus]|uniref:Tudor domain-containing protein n=1 Tax=Brachionus calyciflorus TaxID=104777 RepID=A0A814CR63_9BILA|nr:unnamed protein product [Brachionus calyciflorus]
MSHKIDPNDNIQFLEFKLNQNLIALKKVLKWEKAIEKRIETDNLQIQALKNSKQKPMKTKYENDICEQFDRLGYCKKKYCHHYHKKRSETLVPSIKKKVKIFTECLASHKILKKRTFMLQNIKYIGFDIFQATIINTIDDNTDNFLTCTNISKLISSMNKYYGNKKFLMEKSTIFSIGQIVAARSNVKNIWLRAKIKETNYFDQIDLASYKVEYLDIDGQETLNLKDIYLINEMFLDVVPCKISFSLSNTKITASYDDIVTTFENLIRKFRFFTAHVVDIKGESQFELRLNAVSADLIQINLNDFLVKINQANTIFN